MQRVRLESGEWELVESIGSGGFGSVYRARRDDQECAIKLVPKDVGASRELLFADLDGARNVIPIVESGETEDAWVLAMPLAKGSLREHLGELQQPLGIEAVLAILRDLAAALSDLDGHVVHRDIKPENLLMWNGAWCLAEFGISRYAEATTAEETRKYALSAPYAAPERWRFETATSATDVYSLGVVAYELLTGSPPFAGPSFEAFRQQHLHEAQAPLDGLPPALSALVEECLYKAPGARPSPANLLARLERLVIKPASSAALRLMEANRSEIGRQSEAVRAASIRQTEEERRDSLRTAAVSTLGRISEALKEMVMEAAPAAVVTPDRRGGWQVKLGTAELGLSGAATSRRDNWGHYPPAFDVISHATIAVTIPRYHDYAGRSHSLWFCDAVEEGMYAWYETAFMVTAGMRERGVQDPFALEPSEDSGVAVSPVMGHRQLAWPFVRVDGDGQEEFMERWVGWFADAASERLSHPSTMPERKGSGSYRTK
jgi:serine/threonine-protein kinase